MRPPLRSTKLTSSLSLSEIFMEFKFRAVDDRPLSYISPLTGINHSDQAPRGQTFPPTFNLMMTGVPNAATLGFPGNDLQILPIPMQNSEEARELENARIREEIFAVEIARRRFLEAALRLEIMYLEREMAMRRLTEQFGFQDRWGATPFGPRMPSVQYPFDERLARSSSFSAFNGSPFVPRLDTIAPELMPMSESNKDKLIVLAKPNPTLYGVKRKAETPPTVASNELYPFGIKKKPKEEWSCAICQVSATNEKALNHHIQGKKHKAKEARLRAEKVAKGFNKAPLAKKTSKPLKFTRIGGQEKSALVTDVIEPIQKIDNGNGSDKKNETGDCKVKDEVLLMQKNQNAENLNKESGVKMVPILETSTTAPKKIKKCKLWCEMCQVGAHSSLVMEAHKKGKKHLSRIGTLAQNSAATSRQTDLDVRKSVTVFENKGEEVKNVENKSKEMVIRLKRLAKK